MNQDIEDAKAEVMYLFRYFYKDAWAPHDIFDGRSRAFIKAFNKLVDEGFIERKKVYPGYRYRWVAAYPPGY